MPISCIIPLYYVNYDVILSQLDLIVATKVSNSNVVDVKVLHYLFNIREWISPCLEAIKYHTEPHIFNFHKNTKGQTAMYYKPWAKSDWLPNNDGLLILKVCMYLLMYVLHSSNLTMFAIMRKVVKQERLPISIDVCNLSWL